MASRSNGKQKIDALVFEGGGVLGTAYIGAIRAAAESLEMRKIKKFAGSSVGAIAAAFLACRASIDFIENAFNNTLDLESIADRSRSLTVSLYRLVRRGGIARGIALKTCLERLLRELTGDAQITFSNVFEKYNSILVITGTSLTRAQTEYFGPATHGDMPVLQALLISTAMPGLFPVQQYAREQWSDGGILHNFPIQVFDKPSFIRKRQHYRAIRDPKRRRARSRTVGFKLITKDERGIAAPGQINNGIAAGCAILRMLVDRGQRLHEHEEDWKRTIAIDVGALSSTSFDLTADQKTMLIESGYNAAKQYFQS
jgi:NTE family protein